MGTAQEARQASVRAATGTALGYEGDWHALFDQAGVPAGDFDGRLLAWINAQLGASYGDLNGAMQAFAKSQGAADWESLGAFAVLPTPILLDSFDSSAGWTYSGLSGSTVSNPTKQGSAALLLEGNGVNGTKLATRPTPLLSNIDPSTMGVVACAVYVDPACEHSTPSSWIQFGRGGSWWTVAGGADQQNIGENPNPQTFTTGWHWHVFNVSENPSLQGLGPGSLSVRLRPTSAAPWHPQLIYDALMCNAAGRPTIVLGFDDGYDTQYSEAFSYMSAKGVVGTAYVVPSKVGTGGHMTLAQLQEMKVAGWGMACDGTNDDMPMISHTSVADAVADVNSVRAYLTANGLGGADQDHLCYPNGLFSDGAAPTLIATLTADGSTTVTVPATDSGLIGYTLLGFGIPAGTIVQSVADATRYVVSQAIPVRSALPAAALDRRGVFYNGRLQTALSAAGFKTGRTTLPGVQYSRFGVGDQALNLPGCSTSMGSGITLAAMEGYVDKAITRGSTAIFYIHDIKTTASSIGMTIAGFRSLIDYIAAKRDAGLLDVLTIGQWWARDGG